MKYLKYLLIVIIAFTVNISLASATNKIYNIDVTVNLDTDGTGHITEVWNVKTNEKTEIYKPMSNLVNSEITNFKVSMDGIPFTQKTWNINDSFDNKANKYGINYVSNGLELCFGITSYGTHSYTLTYDVSNMINSVTDSDILYWKFINDNMSSAPESFKVVISGPTAYQDTLDVWGYGYKGYAYVQNGKIYMQSEENTTFTSDNYVVLLVKYPKGVFTTENNSSSFTTFDEFYNQAETGTFDYDYGNDNKTSPFTIFFNIIKFIFVLGIFGAIAKAAKSKGTYIKKPIDKKTLNYFRDIPCDKDVILSNFLSDVYSLSNKKENILGALILKWIKDNQIEIVKTDKKILFINKEVTTLKLNNITTFENRSEKDLYQMMVEASKDNLLEENEFKKWSKNNYKELLKWFDDVLENKRNELVDKNLITVVETGKVFKSKTYTITDPLHEEAVKLAGLKKFLTDFSLINKREPIEVKMWEYYLIYAQIFGIADKVAEAFKNLYPELVENSNYNIDYTTIMLVNSFSHAAYVGASDARRAATSYSGGGGGFSSGGGGGGSFGGGSGGGFR